MDMMRALGVVSFVLCMVATSLPLDVALAQQPTAETAAEPEPQWTEHEWTEHEWTEHEWTEPTYRPPWLERQLAQQRMQELRQQQARAAAEAAAQEEADRGPGVLETSTLLIAGTFFLSSTFEETFDDALAALDYADAPRIWGGDLTVERGITPWFWVGGRADVRTRDWARRGEDSASAFGLSMLATAGLRLAVNRGVDVGLSIGLGFGAIAFRMNGDMELLPSPRASGGAILGFTMAEPVRGFVRVAFDYFEGADINEFGHDVNLTGVSLGVGWEVRD